MVFLYFHRIFFSIKYFSINVIHRLTPTSKYDKLQFFLQGLLGLVFGSWMMLLKLNFGEEASYPVWAITGMGMQKPI